MGTKLTIGEVARRTGVPARTIRFYEAEGVIAAPARTEAGYRLYSPTDIRRLRLAKRTRLLCLSLAEVKLLVDQAFASECGEFAHQLLQRIATQRLDIDARVAELEALRGELDELERHVRHELERSRPGQRVAECSYCPLIDEEGGENDG
ncbi:MAG: MerR family transcriptional regulator [Dehalococcoidia bacterium]